MSPLPSDLLDLIRRNSKADSSNKAGTHHSKATAVAVGVIIPLTVLSAILCAFFYFRLRRNPESRLHRWKTFKSSASSTSEKDSSKSVTSPMGWQQFTNCFQKPHWPQVTKPGWLRLSKPDWSGVHLPKWPERFSKPQLSNMHMPQWFREPPKPQWSAIQMPQWLKRPKQDKPHSGNGSNQTALVYPEDRPDTVSGKYWSAEDIKAMNSRSMSPVSKVTKPAPSIFSSKSYLVSHEPLPQRPSSRHLKTTSKHISAQFLEFSLPQTGSIDNEGGLSKQGSKRDSRAVVTDLNWQDYDPATAGSTSP